MLIRADLTNLDKVPGLGASVQQGFATGEMGSNEKFALQKS